MRWLIIISIALLVSGCGESAYEKEKRERAEKLVKVNETVSKVNVLAEKLSSNIGADGWYKQDEVNATDSWGNALVVKYKRSGGRETLIVWSNGPDSLPYTRDDIRSNSWTLDNEKALAAIRKAKSEGRKAAVEDYSSCLTKGLTKGALQGWRERNK